MRNLNKDEIKLLRLLSDTYNFLNVSDVSADKYNMKDYSKLNYINAKHVNDLPSSLVCKCNNIADIMRSVIDDNEMYEWFARIDFDLDQLVRAMHTINHDKQTYMPEELL